jgi:hypothetical protein
MQCTRVSMLEQTGFFLLCFIVVVLINACGESAHEKKLSACWRVRRRHNDQFTFQCDQAANDLFIEAGLTELDFVLSRIFLIFLN